MLPLPALCFSSISAEWAQCVEALCFSNRALPLSIGWCTWAKMTFNFSLILVHEHAHFLLTITLLINSYSVAIRDNFSRYERQNLISHSLGPAQTTCVEFTVNIYYNELYSTARASWLQLLCEIMVIKYLVSVYGIQLEVQVIYDLALFSGLYWVPQRGCIYILQKWLWLWIKINNIQKVFTCFLSVINSPFYL